MDAWLAALAAAGLTALVVGSRRNKECDWSASVPGPPTHRDSQLSHYYATADAADELRDRLQSIMDDADAFLDDKLSEILEDAYEAGYLDEDDY